MDLVYGHNQNEEAHGDSEYQDLPTCRVRGSNINSRLDRISRMLEDAVLEGSQFCLISCDLWCPRGWHDDNEVISQFFASLQAQIDSDGERKWIQADSVGQRKIRHIWVRDSPLRESIRYRIAILINQDVYRNLGSSRVTEPEPQDVGDTTVTQELAQRVKKAWATSLQLSSDDVTAMIKFTGGPVYTLNTDNGSFAHQCQSVFHRFSHVIEAAIKGADDDPNGFGCSLPRVWRRRHSAG